MTYQSPRVITSEKFPGKDGRPPQAVENPSRDAFASGNRFLSTLPAAVYRRLRPHLKNLELEKDEYLYQQDDVVDAVYFPATAVISEFQILEDGRTIEVAITGSEGAVGLAAAFGKCSAPSCTQACVPGKIWKIKGEVLERQIEADPALNRIFHAQINSNIRQLSQKIACNTYHSLEQRLCTWLLTMSDRTGGATLRVTQEHVARVLGVHRPSVTCIAQVLRDHGSIDYRRGRVEILDRRGLRASACPCYTESAVLPSGIR